MVCRLGKGFEDARQHFLDSYQEDLGFKQWKAESECVLNNARHKVYVTALTTQKHKKCRLDIKGCSFYLHTIASNTFLTLNKVMFKLSKQYYIIFVFFLRKKSVKIKNKALLV